MVKPGASPPTHCVVCFRFIYATGESLISAPLVRA